LRINTDKSWGLWLVSADPEVQAVLESAGLADLAGLFAAHGITGAALWSISEDDLRGLGMSFGQRKRLLRRLRPQAAAAETSDADGEAMVPAPLAIAAAEQALQRSAVQEAVQFLAQAEEALARFDDHAEADPLRLRLLIARSAISRVQQGIASDEAGRLGRQVLELARKLRETRSELMALTGLYTHALVRAEYFNAEKWAQLLSERAEQTQDDTFRMIGRRATGVVALHLGSLPQAAAALQEALDSYDEARHLPLASAHGYDHAEICAAFLSIALWISGDPAGGREMSEFSASHSRHIGHMHSLTQALVFRAMLMALAQDWAACLAAAQEGEAVGLQHGLNVMGTACSFFATVARLTAAPEPPREGDLKALLRSHAEFRRVNPYNYQPVAWLLLAALQLKAGDLAAAEEALHHAEAVQARTREVLAAPELLRMRAQILRAKGDAAAGAALAEALQAATRMGATMFALRIACEMAELEPNPASLAQLNAVYGRLVSSDRGEDVRRCMALLQ
jgi:hypothetical protein